jgi:hypothetical protein
MPAAHAHVLGGLDATKAEGRQCRHDGPYKRIICIDLKVGLLGQAYQREDHEREGLASCLLVALGG